VLEERVFLGEEERGAREVDEPGLIRGQGLVRALSFL
jgi:hypothetical protein